MFPPYGFSPHLSCAIAACAFIAASSVAIPSAHAQDDKTATQSSTIGPAAPTAAADGTRAPREADGDRHKHVAVTLNPLGFAVQRYGANLEVLPVPHHALTGSLYLQSMPAWIARSISGRSEINEDRGSSVGGELGYRLYSGARGANGLFVGASFVSMPLAYPRVADDLASVDLQRFNATGAALDLGAQLVTTDGFTLGGGIGVMYLGYELPADSRRVPLAIEPHVLPRLLLAAGWSF